MKQIILFLLLACTIHAQDQLGPESTAYTIEDNQIVYTQVITVSGMSAQELYDRSLDWIPTYFDDFKSEAFDIRDRDAGRIRVNTIKHINPWAVLIKDQRIVAVINIDTKQDKVRFQYRDLAIGGYILGNYEKIPMTQYYDNVLKKNGKIFKKNHNIMLQAYQQYQDMILSYQKYITKSDQW